MINDKSEECKVCTHDSVELINYVLALGADKEGRRVPRAKLAELYGIPLAALTFHVKHEAVKIMELRSQGEVLRNKVDSWKAREMAAEVFENAMVRARDLGTNATEVMGLGELGLKAAELVGKIDGELVQPGQVGVGGGGTGNGTGQTTQVVMVMPNVFGKTDEEIRRVISGVGAVSELTKAKDAIIEAEAQ